MGKRFGFNFMGGSKPSYTPAEKKGEINELRAQLRHPDTEKDASKKRECLKKVIAYMTLGIDTQPLFTEMIMACATKDLVQKKMVYLYLCTHAETNQDIAILAINTLQKDCKDESPLVRGLALRSISSLKLTTIVEYIVPILKQAMQDSSPYVRKTAVISSCKLWKMNPESFEQLNIKDKLHSMIRDGDPHVCCNSIVVLNEVLEEEGGLQINKQVIYLLLNRLRDLNEWQQCLVLELVLRYVPADEEEMFNIMNLLEERLWGSNSAVILSTTHVFLTLTQNLPQLHRQVYSRLKEPLLTLIATAPMETAYACLCHIKLLISREPDVFADNFKDFFCRYNDPSFVKGLKLEILVSISNEKNFRDIMTELSAYVSDVQVETVRRAIRSMGEIALKVPNGGKQAVNHFLEFLDMEMDFVRSETLSVLKDFLRKYTDIELIEPFFPAIIKHWKQMEDAACKVAFVWILGEFGENIDDAPYILESYVERFKDEPHQVRLELLTASMKLFFKRPPEMQPVLGPLLDEAINDFSHADVHDRALLYYRLLVKNPKVGAQVVCCRKEPVQSFDTLESAEVRDKLFEEFNSLSVVFNMPASRFIVKKDGIIGEGDEEEESSEEDSDDSDDDDSDEDESDDEDGPRGTQAGLLAGASDIVAARQKKANRLQLVPEPTVDHQQYQQKWGTLEVAFNISQQLRAQPPAKDFEEQLKKGSLLCLASGQTPDRSLKFYFYGVSYQQEAVFLELVIDATGKLSCVGKLDNPDMATLVADHIKGGIKAFI